MEVTLIAAQSLYVEERFAEAAASYSTYLATTQDIPGFSGRAACYLQLKKHTHALQDLDAAIRLGSKKHVDYFRRAVALFELEEYESAKDAFETAADVRRREADPDTSAHERYIRKCVAEMEGA